MQFVRTLSLTMPLLVVAGWSAAEAAIFFLVADVPISWIAVRHGTKAAILAALIAAIASVAGVLALWAWSHWDPVMSATVMTLLPGIDDRTLARAAQIYADGYVAILVASFQGIPFKLFVLESGPNLIFLILAPLIRFPRFVMVAIFSGLVSEGLSRWLSLRARFVLLGLLWIAFYAFYWWAMSD